MSGTLEFVDQHLDKADLDRRLELALEASGIGIWQHNGTTGEIAWDDRLRNLYGLAPGASASSWINLVHPLDRLKAEHDFLEALRLKSHYSSRFRIIRPDGEVRHIQSRAHYHQNQNGDALMIGAEWDVTADVLREEELRTRTLELEALRREAERAAASDHLTNLPNRRALDAFIGSQPGTNVTTRAALHIDLDDFKSINDEHGHEAGDEHLRKFAKGIRMMVPSEAFAARLGGDEFVVLLPSASVQSASLLASSLIALAASLSSQLHAGSGAASIGISMGSGGWQQHIVASDEALYEAKRSGRGKYVLRDGSEVYRGRSSDPVLAR